MSTFGLLDLEQGGSTSVTERSGRDPRDGRLHSAERVLAVGGTGTGLIDANRAPADVGPRPCVPGPGVDRGIDPFVAELVAAIRVTLAGTDHPCGPGPGAPVRENVALLFTELVGWTGTSRRMGPEAADALRQCHVSILRGAITSTRGTEASGPADGSMAVFRTASAALDCAVAMQQGVDCENRISGHPLGLRVGLSGGEVTREGVAYFGDPVIEAARLCTRASNGKILAAQVVKEMVGRRARYPYRALGRLELRGLPEPREAFEVGWDPVAEHATSYGSSRYVPAPHLQRDHVRFGEPVGTGAARPRTKEEGHVLVADQ